MGLCKDQWVTHMQKQCLNLSEFLVDVLLQWIHTLGVVDAALGGTSEFDYCALIAEVYQVSAAACFVARYMQKQGWKPELITNIPTVEVGPRQCQQLCIF